MISSMHKSPAWRDAFEATGFHRVQNGNGFRHNGMSLTVDESWLTLSTRHGATANSLLGDLGKPGLWKTVDLKNGKPIGREFHLPMAALAGVKEWADGGDQDDSNPIETCLRWAAKTVGRQRLPSWTSPPRQQIDAWIQPADLVLQNGALIVQGSVTHAPDQLAICFPILSELPAAMTAARREWLQAVLADATNRWRMVRVGLSDSQTPAVSAEVDFSGAPSAVIEDLVKAGLDAVRLVTMSILWPVVLLSDLDVPSRIWDEPITRAWPAERRRG
jgi:hypothetical protein